MAFDEVAEAHQLMHENKHLGQDRDPRRRHRGGPGQDRATGPGAIRAEVGRLMAGVVHIPWYATGFRGDELEAALAEIAPVALRYGARSYAVYRYRDDRYKFLQMAEFERKDRLGALLDGPGVHRLPRRELELVPGAGALRLDRPGGRGRR